MKQIFDENLYPNASFCPPQFAPFIIVKKSHDAYINEDDYINDDERIGKAGYISMEMKVYQRRSIHQ